MHRVHLHAEDGIGSSSGSDTRSATIIGITIMGVLVILFLLSTVFDSGGGGGQPVITLQTVPEDTSSVDTVPPGERYGMADEKPRFWLQARSGPMGDAGWGPEVVGPFETLWQVQSGGGREFFSSPALVEGVLYFGCNDGYLRAVDAGTGSVKWSFSTACGICGEPAVDSSTVYVGGQDGYVYALNRSNGSKRWSAGLGYHVFCDTGIMCDTLILSGNSMGKVCALNSETGEPVWDREIGGIVLGPAVVDTLAVFTSESGATVVIDHRGQQVWSRSGSVQASRPSADSVSVYVGFAGGMVRRFNLLTGDLIWETDIYSGTGRCVLARPVITGSRVLVGTYNGEMACLDRSSGAVLWTQEFQNWLQLPPAVSGRLIYVACDDQRLHVLELETGEKVDSLEMDGYSGTAPLLHREVLYFGNTSGDFVAVRGSLPQVEEETGQDSVALQTPADTLTSPPASDSLPADAPEETESVQVMPLPEDEEELAEPDPADSL